MEITEKERQMLGEKKETICRLTLEILDLVHDPENSLKIKKNITTILSHLSTMASYSDLKNHALDVLTENANNLFDMLTRDPKSKSLSEELEKKFDQIYLNLYERVGIQRIGVFCNYVNSVRFDFTNKKGIKIVLPKNLNLGFIANKQQMILT